MAQAAIQYATCAQVQLRCSGYFCLSSYSSALKLLKAVLHGQAIHYDSLEIFWQPLTLQQVHKGLWTKGLLSGSMQFSTGSCDLAKIGMMPCQDIDESAATRWWPRNESRKML